jgi:cellulose synthase/poly-beta-1,6-N-acetylglucosamine synthase-like glycosyltransferase
MEKQAHKLERIRAIQINAGPSRWQKMVPLGAMAIFLLIMASFGAAAALSVTVCLGIGMFALILANKVWITVHASQGFLKLGPLVSDDECLPVVMLLPCYGEVSILQQLVRAMSAIDYPTDKVIFALLLEEDDQPMVRAALSTNLPSNFAVIAVPQTYLPGVRSKPRALTFGLTALRDYLTFSTIVGIYDAEDQPEKDQLRKVATAFTQHPEVACVQGKLRWHNATTNYVTAGNAISYHTHYEFDLPGSMATNGVAPLGGTTNFIRYTALEDVGGWDPAHVAEDQDLGCKLTRAGCQVRMIDTVTWEEALETPWKRVKQLSRWTKGGIATTISHTRDLKGFWYDYGVKKGFSFWSMIAASHPAAVLAPLYWMMTIVYLMTKTSLVQQVTPTAAFYLGSICLLANAFFLFRGAYALLAGGQPELIRYLPLMPIEWLFIGFMAGVLASYEVATGKISKWHKTEHGLVQPPIRVTTPEYVTAGD